MTNKNREAVNYYQLDNHGHFPQRRLRGLSFKGITGLGDCTTPEPPPCQNTNCGFCICDCGGGSS